MRKMTRQFLGFVLAMVMVISQFASAGTTTVAAEETTEYTFTAEASATSVKVGETTTLTSKVLCGEEEITDLSATEYTIWWSVNGNNWSNATFGYGTNADGKALEATASFDVAGTYYLVGKLQNASWTILKEVYFTVEVAERSTEDGGSEIVTYDITVTPTATEVEQGETVTYTAVVTKNGETVTDLVAEGLKVWWWSDSWNDHSDGLADSWYSDYDNNSGNSLTAKVTLPSVGTYYVVGQLEYNGTKLPVVIPMTTTEPEVEEENTYITGELSVEKIQKLPEDFIMGMDISSVNS